MRSCIRPWSWPAGTASRADSHVLTRRSSRTSWGRPASPHELFARNLPQVAGCLQRAGIPAVLIEVGLPGDHVGTSIDLVIPEQDWQRRAGRPGRLVRVRARRTSSSTPTSALALPVNWARTAPAYRRLLVRRSGVPYRPTAGPRPQEPRWLPHPAPARLPADLARPGTIPGPSTGPVRAARRVQPATSHGDHGRARRGEPGRVACRFRRRASGCGRRHRPPRPRASGQPAGTGARVAVTEDKSGPRASLASEGTARIR